MSGSLSLIRGRRTSILKDFEGVTLIDLLRASAAEHVDRGVTIVDRKGVESARTYPTIIEGIERAAARLRGHGVKAGERVLVCLPTSWDLLDLWLGCVYLGAHPACITPPAGSVGPTSDAHDRLDRFRSVIEAHHFIGKLSLVERLRDRYTSLLASISVSSAELSSPTAPPDVEQHRADGDDLAFLQFTSGSTGVPRAVMIPHRTLVHNLSSLDVACGAPYGARSGEWNECFLSWLPLSHDMGLIGCFFGMSTGMAVVLMAPGSFLGRPHRWLLAGSGRRFISPAPTFGFHFCVDRIEEAQLEGIDLSQPKRFCIGSEMVRPDTMRAFLTKLARTGLEPEHLQACYGMAETTVGLTFDQAGRGIRVSAPDGGEAPRWAAEVACCGTPIPDTDVRVVDPENERVVLQEGRVGAVQARGPSVFAGYYGDEAATREAFVDGWLRTGDLGFIRDGELYVTGRAKEVLIVRGENIMPQDIEWQVDQARDGMGAEGSGAFSVVRGPAGEEPVLVVETTLTDSEAIARLDREIRSRVGRALGLVLADVAFVRRGRLPRTTSGKIRRMALKEAYLCGGIERLNPLEPRRPAP